MKLQVYKHNATGKYVVEVDGKMVQKVYNNFYEILCDINPQKAHAMLVESTYKLQKLLR